MSYNRTYVLGMGAQKSGTTWLYNYFNSLESFAMGFRKEYHVLDALFVDAMPGRKKGTMKRGVKGLARKLGEKENIKSVHQALLTMSPDEYFDYFHGLLARTGRRFTADMTPTHSALPKLALRRVQREFDRRGIGVKPLFVMRDPVERAWSALRMARRDRSLNLSDFKSLGVSNPYKMTDDELLCILTSTPSYRLRGNYPKVIKKLEDVFPKDDIVLAFYEEMFTEPVMRGIAEQIGFAYRRPNFDFTANVSQKDRLLLPQTEHDLTLYFRPIYKYCADRWGAQHLAEIWPNSRRIWRDIAPTALPVASWDQYVPPKRRRTVDWISKVVLHIGTHKTGSSSVQAMLHRNSKLLADRGILYPPLRQSDRHSLLAIPHLGRVPREFWARFGTDVDRASVEVDTMWDEMAEAVTSMDDIHTLVLSSEHFSRLDDPAALIERVRRLAPKADIQSLCYLRRPDARFLSGTQQLLKGSHRLRWPHQIDLLPNLDAWAAQTTLVMREFDRAHLHDGDVVVDVLSHLGWTEGTDMLHQVGDTNASLSAEGMAVVLAFRKSIYGDRPNLMTQATGKLIKLVSEAGADLPEDLRPLPPVLHPAVADAAMHASQGSMHHLRDALGFAFHDPALYDRAIYTARTKAAPLPIDQQPELTDLISLDPDRVAALYSAVLARLL